MGVDHRLLAPQRVLAADIEVPTWIPPGADETLRGYAHRLAGTIDCSRPFFLGGVSFGGMLAVEMVPLLRHRLCGLILIATASSNQAIPWTHRIGLSIGARLPARALAAAKTLSPLLRAVMGVLRPADARMLNDIMRHADPLLLKWSMNAINRWTGCPQIPAEVPYIWIHGADDLLLPIRKSAASHRIKGAGHLVNVTHAHDVNAAISAWLQTLARDNGLR